MKIKYKYGSFEVDVERERDQTYINLKVIFMSEQL